MSNGTEKTMALGIIIVAIIIAVGMVAEKVPISEGAQLLTALLGGEVLIWLAMSRNRINN